MRSFLTCLSVMLHISPLSPLCSLDPPVHSICTFFPCGLDASTCVPICFQLRVSCRSYCTVMGQVTHLAAPGRDVTLPSLLHLRHPLYGAEWLEIFRWLFRLLKQQNRYRTKTLRRGLSFISELSRGYACSCSRAFQPYTATQHLSIIN